MQAGTSMDRHMMNKSAPGGWTGEFGRDCVLLHDRLTGEREARGRWLPALAGAGESTAGRARTVGLRLRREFLRLHAEHLYAELVDHRDGGVTLWDLVAAAAKVAPGLVATMEELEQEGKLRQVEKTGLELELGLLFEGFLRAPVAGRHIVHSMLQATSRAVEALPEFRRTGSADFGEATVERLDGVGYVTMHNDRFLNAEDNAVVEAVETAVDLVLLDDSIAVGVLRGGEVSHPRYKGRRVFNAGINLTHLYHGKISFIDFLLRRELGYISKMFRGLARDALDGWESSDTVSKPWIGAVDTFAIGGGAQILLALDCVVAEESAYFALPALREGIIPGAANLRLPRFLGNRPARRMIFSGHTIRAGEPGFGQLCDEVVAAADMDAAVRGTARRLSNPAVVANRRVMNDAEEPMDAFRLYMASYACEQTRRLYSVDLIANLEHSWINRKRDAGLHQD